MNENDVNRGNGSNCMTVDFKIHLSIETFFEYFYKQHIQIHDSYLLLIAENHKFDSFSLTFLYKVKEE